ncbi:MAG: RNA methyltransferase [Puniceicoccaceae bacterium]|nr:MAG: RNA methyltransferase [Puniceicoccaceae bacterium]
MSKNPPPLSKARLASLRRLTRRKSRVEDGRILLEGWHLLEAALEAGRALGVLAMTPQALAAGGANGRLLEKALDRAEAGGWIEEAELSRICGEAADQGVVAAVDWAPVGVRQVLRRAGAALADGRTPVVVAGDGLQEPGNLGTLIRLADWFGCTGVVLSSGTVDPGNPKVVRAGMGSHFHVPVAVGAALPEVVEQARRLGWWTVVAAGEGECGLRAGPPDRPVLLVVGNEARGVSPAVREAAEVRMAIPRWGRVESLNAAVAAAVFLGAWRIPGG